MPTCHQVGVGSAPDVSVLAGEDADGLVVALCRHAADSLQLDAELLGRQRHPVAGIHVQHEELRSHEMGCDTDITLEAGLWAPHLTVVYHSDVSWGGGAPRVVHHCIPLQSGDAAG